MRSLWIVFGWLFLVQIAPGESVVAPGATPVRVSREFLFTEGPAADGEGNVYFTDQPNDRILRWSPDGAITEWLKPAGRSNGLYFDSQGNLIACADGANEIWSISPEKKVTVLLKDFGRQLLNGPNDLWITPTGDFYFTDPLYKRDYWKRSPERQQPGEYVYRFERKTGTVRVVETELTRPNGIIGTPDGKTLYVADLGARKSYQYQIAEDGSLVAKKLFCERGSDGMTLDAEGNLYLTGRTGVTVFNAQGEEIEQIAIPEPWTANVTFGGKDRKTLFITASRAVYTVAMRVAGAR